MSALRICSEHGCPKVAVKQGRCAECFEAHRKAKIARMDEGRLSAARRGYDNMHRKWRAEVLARDPICRWERGVCLEPSTVADHIKPISEGGSRFRLENGQGLCAYHHDVKRQQESVRAKQGKGGAPSRALRRRL